MLCLSGFELYSRWVPLGFHEICALFSPGNIFKLQFLPYNSPFFCLAFDNEFETN